MLTLGKVYQIYPQANMVDVMMFDGSILKKVQVMCPVSSSTVGAINMPVPKYKTDMIKRDSPLAQAKQNESDVIAVIGFLGESLLNPVVLGFLFPELNEILCGRDQKGNKDGTQFLWKHESNVYFRIVKGDTLDKPAEIEISHPSGLFVKIGENDDLTEITNWDKNVRPFKKVNPVTDKVDPAPYVHLEHPSGTWLTIEPSGNVNIYVKGDVQKTITGDYQETIQGNVTREVDGDEIETIKGSVTRTVEVDENETINGDLTKTIEGNKDETVDGDLNETVQGNAEESVIGDLTKIVSGSETDTITGAWDRSSSASIKDTAPSVEHN